LEDIIKELRRLTIIDGSFDIDANLITVEEYLAALQRERKELQKAQGKLDDEPEEEPSPPLPCLKEDDEHENTVEEVIGAERQATVGSRVLAAGRLGAIVHHDLDDARLKVEFDDGSTDWFVNTEVTVALAKQKLASEEVESGMSAVKEAVKDTPLVAFMDEAEVNDTIKAEEAVADKKAEGKDESQFESFLFNPSTATHLNPNVQNLQVSISDRRTQPHSWMSLTLASGRSEKPRCGKCPNCTHKLEKLDPQCIIALLHSRKQCDECGKTIRRRESRYICRECAPPSCRAVIEGSRSQASGYTMCTTCATTPIATPE
jgi:hypothetical protein